MPLSDLTPGQTAELALTVKPEHFASQIVSGTPDVFSTASLGALVEKAAAEWLASHLEQGQMSVGTQIVINHTGATPEGMSVTATVTLREVEGRRLDFSWTARDEVEEVGNGTHQRFVIDATRFMERLRAKRGA